MKNEKGMTLVEIVIGSGLLVVISFVSLAVIQGFNQSTARNEAKMHQIHLQHEIKEVISNSGSCSTAFVNRSFDPTANSQISLRLRNDIVISSDQAHRRRPEYHLEVTSFQLMNKRQVATTPTGRRVYSAQLELGSMSLKDRQEFKNSSIAYVFLQVDGTNQIVDCNTEEIQLAETAPTCASLGGILVAANDCRMPAGQTSKTCGAGQYLQGFDTEGLTVCRTIPVPPPPPPPPVCTPELQSQGSGNGATPKVFGADACNASCLGTYGAGSFCGGGCYMGYRRWMYCGDCVVERVVCR